MHKLLLSSAILLALTTTGFAQSASVGGDLNDAIAGGDVRADPGAVGGGNSYAAIAHTIDVSRGSSFAGDISKDKAFGSKGYDNLSKPADPTEVKDWPVKQ
jgi:hypothetical protein